MNTFFPQTAEMAKAGNVPLHVFVDVLQSRNYQQLLKYLPGDAIETRFDVLVNSQIPERFKSKLQNRAYNSGWLPLLREYILSTHYVDNLLLEALRNAWDAYFPLCFHDEIKPCLLSAQKAVSDLSNRHPEVIQFLNGVDKLSNTISCYFPDMPRFTAENIGYGVAEFEKRFDRNVRIYCSAQPILEERMPRHVKADFIAVIEQIENEFRFWNQDAEKIFQAITLAEYLEYHKNIYCQ